MWILIWTKTTSDRRIGPKNRTTGGFAYPYSTPFVVRGMLLVRSGQFNFLGEGEGQGVLWMLLEKKMIVQYKRKQLHVAGAGVRKLWSRKKHPGRKLYLALFPHGWVQLWLVQVRLVFRLFKAGMGKYFMSSQHIVSLHIRCFPKLRRFAFLRCFACLRCFAYLRCFACLRCFAFLSCFACLKCFACLRCFAFLRCFACLRCKAKERQRGPSARRKCSNSNKEFICNYHKKI